MIKLPAADILQAVRTLYEGAPVSLALLARICGRTEIYLAQTAEREGWQSPQAETAAGEKLEERLLALSNQLVNDLEEASTEGRATRKYDKKTIDALGAMLRMVEKIGEIARRVPERAAEIQKKSDEELAAALAAIDARIVELACELAASMGSEQTPRTGSLQSPG